MGIKKSLNSFICIRKNPNKLMKLIKCYLTVKLNLVMTYLSWEALASLQILVKVGRSKGTPNEQGGKVIPKCLG